MLLVVVVDCGCHYAVDVVGWSWLSVLLVFFDVDFVVGGLGLIWCCLC